VLGRLVVGQEVVGGLVGTADEGAKLGGSVGDIDGLLVVGGVDG